VRLAGDMRWGSKEISFAFCAEQNTKKHFFFKFPFYSDFSSLSFLAALEIGDKKRPK
jgi:hypothetical protein